MKKIKLHGKHGVGKFAIIDDIDYLRIKDKKWRLSQNGYVSENTAYGVYLHRFILGAKKKVYVDHINHNPLDNRRKNIRLCSNEVNNWNRNYKRIVGVSKTKRHKTKTWRAYITKYYKQIHLGYFETKEEAILAYDNAVAEMRDEFSFKNKNLNYDNY